MRQAVTRTHRIERGVSSRRSSPRAFWGLGALCATGTIAAAIHAGVDVCGKRADDLPGHPCVLLLAFGLVAAVIAIIWLCRATIDIAIGCVGTFRWLIRRSAQKPPPAAAALRTAAESSHWGTQLLVRRGHLRAPPARAI